jgi:hypothetical protein
MPSTFPDHFASDENVAKAVDRAEHTSEDDPSEPTTAAAESGDPTDRSTGDCRPLCGVRIEELQSRVDQLERQLERLLADDHSAVAWSMDSEPDGVDSDEQRLQACQIGPGGDQDTGSQWTEVPVVGVTPIGVIDEAASAAASDTPADSPGLPTWAEAYQNDDVDDSVKEYVDRLLQRIASNGDEPGCLPKTGMETHDKTRTPRVPSAIGDLLESSATAGSLRVALASSEPPSTEAAHGDRRGSESATAHESRRQDDEYVPTSDFMRTPLEATPVVSTGYDATEAYAPRSLPPERLANLAEMRELANISATAAIRTFEKGRAAKHAFDRLPLLMVGLSCGLFLLYFATTCDSPLMRLSLYGGAGLSFLAAAVAAGQAISVLSRWILRVKEDEDTTVG